MKKTVVTILTSLMLIAATLATDTGILSLSQVTAEAATKSKITYDTPTNYGGSITPYDATIASQYNNSGESLLISVRTSKVGNLRIGPSTDTAIVGLVKSGKTLQVTRVVNKDTDNAYYRVHYDYNDDGVEEDVFIQAALTKEVADKDVTVVGNSSAEGVNYSGTYYITTKTADTYINPVSGSTKKSSYKFGVKVVIKGIVTQYRGHNSTKWYKLNNGAYIQSKYISREKPSEIEVTNFDKTKKCTTTANLVLRKRPSTSGGKITTIEKGNKTVVAYGQAVSYKGEKISEKWYQVTVTVGKKSYSGYVDASYLKAIK
jgi:hypothetical protein